MKNTTLLSLIFMLNFYLHIFSQEPCTVKIMPMGDSITAGYTDNPQWNTDFNFGYRGHLYTALTNAGYNVQYIGGSPEPWNEAFGDPSHGGTYSPEFDLREIGQDNHYGFGGTAVEYINARIEDWLEIEQPDIILLKIGTNVPDRIGLDALLNYITTNYPDIHIIVAQIIPKVAWSHIIAYYNDYIRDELVPSYQSLDRNVTTVDMYTPFLTDENDLTSINPTLFSNGINHPNDEGYAIMCQVWKDGIDALNICEGLGVNENENNSFKVYPNPMDYTNVLIIESPINNIEKMEVFNVSGVLITTYEYSELNRKATINIQDLPSGLYFVRVNGVGNSVKIIR